MPSISNLEAGEEGIGHVETCGFLGDSAVFASAEGDMYFLDDEQSSIRVHDGLLAAKVSQDGRALITSGEDGKVCRVHHDQTVDVLYEQKGWWIDQLASGPSGAIAFGTGKKGIVLFEDGKAKSFSCERTIEGLAFAPKGMRLAIARYDGVELLWITTQNPPQFLEWKGAHIGVMFSPDGKYVVSTMQENALHGWRLSDSKHMQMTGYPAKVKSLSFSHKTKWLASSGAPTAVTWPFTGKDGPMGKSPKELGSMGNKLVTHVSCHPSEEVVAIGYEDGMIMAVRIEDGKEAILRPEGEGSVSTLGWEKSGTRLAFGTQTGEAGVVSLKE